MIKYKDAVYIAIISSVLLFLTGIETIPVVNKVSHDILLQNILYTIGRVPVLFTAVVIYFNLLKEDDA